MKTNFYWSTVALQSWVSFYCTAKWIRDSYTNTYHFWIFFPFRSPQSTEFPELYRRYSLVFYFIHSIKEEKNDQSCLTFCNPINCSPPVLWSPTVSSVYGIPQAGIQEWVAISFSWIYIYTHTHIYIYIYIPWRYGSVAQVQSLGLKDPLEEGMAIHSRILDWRTPWTEEPGRLQYIGSQRVRHDWSSWAHP